MQNQVLTIKQCQELMALKLDMSNASLMWDLNPHDSYDEYELTFSNAIMMDLSRFIPTYTLNDIFNIFDTKILQQDLTININIDLLNKTIYIEKIDEYHYYFTGNTILDAAFKMLKFCLQNKIIC